MEDAFARYRAAATSAGAGGGWRPALASSPPACRYIEHLSGEFRGRQAVLDWITPVMTVWPFDHMREFPWDWYTIDAEQGWVVGQVENRFVDPGDGKVYQGANWTRLAYAGDGPFAPAGEGATPADA